MHLHFIVYIAQKAGDRTDSTVFKATGKCLACFELHGTTLFLYYYRISERWRDPSRCNFYCEAAEISKWDEPPNHLKSVDQNLDLASWESQ